ncbi:hypothetical protein [uncultured Duncaniella sp.]|uniref:gp53-like domain-containing protein n=1 Tax=uncultured Duncaniella sp. TaxID=2768039 RepID=UPI0025A637DB|nr:hypothetical protein [uncultured Duncaniella sp.]
MAIRTIAQLKAWFRRGKYPTEEQFADWLDSYVHKEESIIPVIQVEGLAEQLNSKYVASEGHELERQHIELKGDYETHRKTSDERFDNISGCIEDLETENERQQTEIDSLNAEVEVIHTKDSSQDKEISALHDTDRDQQMSIDSLDGRADTLELGIRMHVSDTDNPHRVDKSQVGLGNVPNVATNDQTPTYTAAPSLTDLSSGEKLSSAFGKLMKAVSSLISHISSRDNPHQVTATQVGASPSGHNHDSTYQPKGNYAPATHTHTAAQVTGDASHRFVTDAEKSAWNSKAGGSHNHDSVYQPKGDYLLSSQLQDLKGDKGDKGDKGAVFTPAVDSSGNLTWSNNGGLTNPAAVNIRGPKGDTGPQGLKGDTGIQGPKGDTGATGPKGSDATVTKAAVEAVLTGFISSHEHVVPSTVALADLSNVSIRIFGTSSGYHKLPDGLLIQWGFLKSNQDANFVQRVYLQRAYRDTSYAIFTTTASIYQQYYVGRNVCEQTTTYFKVSANQKNQEAFFYMAIGPWK